MVKDKRRLAHGTNGTFCGFLDFLQLFLFIFANCLFKLFYYYTVYYFEHWNS